LIRAPGVGPAFSHTWSCFWSVGGSDLVSRCLDSLKAAGSLERSRSLKVVGSSEGSRSSSLKAEASSEAAVAVALVVGHPRSETRIQTRTLLCRTRLTTALVA